MQQKRADSAITESRDAPKAKRQKRTTKSFAFFPRDWTTVRTFDAKVSLLKARCQDRGGLQLIVKKVLKVEENSAKDPRPFEIRALAMLPRCSRIVHALTCVASDEPDCGIALFEYYPLGDLAIWKDREFDRKNSKPVPESYIWRFFVQMTQALAFLQGKIGPDEGSRHPMLHRDIKPKNVLVVDIGTTYPSFRLHDFGCATIWREDRQSLSSYCGTYDWQPPENPLINTTAAECWALGACVHFLATGQKPVENTQRNRDACLKKAKNNNMLDVTEHENYSSSGRYFAARVPRRVIPINLDAEAQHLRGIARRESPHHQYSDELNHWMIQCLKWAPTERPTVEILMSSMFPTSQLALRQLGGTAAQADLKVIY